MATGRKAFHPVPPEAYSGGANTPGPNLRWPAGHGGTFSAVHFEPEHFVLRNLENPLIYRASRCSCFYAPPHLRSMVVPGNQAPKWRIYQLLHAWLLPFSFIGSLSTDYRIYAFPNSGRGYDFGYLIGVSALTGGAGRATKKGHTEE
jgi:hypothetical protein